MRGDPVLARRTINGRPYGVEALVNMTVTGGLHYIRGNSSPYFSLTCEVRSQRGRDISGGADHELIVKKFPKFADLAALHLSDIDGVPGSAAENAFFHLGGCTEFRPGSLYASRDREPYGAKYDVAANHLRITEAEARQLVTDLFGDHFSESGGFLTKGAELAAKARLAAWCEGQKPRWKAEAAACIAKHNLIVYGDPWPTVGLVEVDGGLPQP